MFSRVLSCFTIFLLLSCLSPVEAADLRISMVQPMASDTNSVWYKLSRAIAREWNEGTVFFLPATTFNNSVENVVSGKADVHFPLMQSPARADEELPFRYSSFTMSETPFALYVPKGSGLVQRKNLTIAALSKHHIETDVTHAGLFFSSLNGVESIETGLRRASSGQSDGFLFAARTTDAVLKRLKLENLVRIPYRRVQDKMIFLKGPAGDELDEKLSFIIDRLKDSGEYQKIMAPKLKESDSQ